MAEESITREQVTEALDRVFAASQRLCSSKARRDMRAAFVVVNQYVAENIRDYGAEDREARDDELLNFAVDACFCFHKYASWSQ